MWGKEEGAFLTDVDSLMELPTWIDTRRSLTHKKQTGKKRGKNSLLLFSSQVFPSALTYFLCVQLPTSELHEKKKK